LFRGPLGGTGRALAAGELSPAHAAVLAAGTQDLPAATAAEAEPVLLATARRLGPPGLRKLVAQLCEVADPDAAAAQAQRQHARRGLWVSATMAGMAAPPTWPTWRCCAAPTTAQSTKAAGTSNATPTGT
jgi:Domain of unknown function (DUF222)